MPHALDILLGFMDNKKIGIVQTPQDFYNTNSFQYSNHKKTGALWHDQSFFYNIAQSCRDFCDSASCIGTGVVYRRKALDKIGGVPTDTLTEDTHTSVKMDKVGYKTLFFNESIAFGIAAANLDEYFTTRHRWAHGNMQISKKEQIFFSKKLTLGPIK